MSAVTLEFSIVESDDQTTINITDLTGIYNASTNIGGWGSPNPVVGSALTATLGISKRNDDGTYTAYTTIDLFPTLPNITETGFDITAEDAGFGLNATWPDSVFQFTYTVTGSAFTYQTVSYIPLTGAIEECYKKSALAACPCSCDNIDEDFLELQINILLLENAEEKGDLTLIQDYINTITKQCADCGCC